MKKKLKKPAPTTHVVSDKRPFPHWFYSRPDERNELIDNARILVGSVLSGLGRESLKEMPVWAKEARRFMKESKP